jgi:hypothetical protein
MVHRPLIFDGLKIPGSFPPWAETSAASQDAPHVSGEQGAAGPQKR